MVEQTTHQWCTTKDAARKKLLAMLPTPPDFLGTVPKTSGPTRPKARYVFLVHNKKQRYLVSGETLEEIAKEIV